MRVLFPFSAPRPGGAEVAAIALMRGLQRRGIEVLWTATAPEVGQVLGDLVGRTDRPQLRLTGPPPGLREQIRGLRTAILPAAAALRELGIDLVHTNDVDAHRAWVLACLRAGLPHVWHHHNAELPALPGPAAITRGRAVWPTSAVVAVSEFARGGVPAPLLPHTTVVRNPVEPPASVAHGPLSPLRLVFIGRLVDWKRPLVLVELLAELRRRQRPVEGAVYVGEGAAEVQAEVLRRAGELGVTEHVELLGWHEDPFAATRRGDIVVCPSVGEPYGRVVVEAMLVGLPVVASDSGGHRETVDHERTGLLVPANDIAAFADAVELLLDRPDLAARMAERASLWAHAHHRADEHVERMLEVYGSAMARTGPRRLLAR
jgi:glycosyltransferase involved in cell wall biosynthesis